MNEPTTSPVDLFSARGRMGRLRFYTYLVVAYLLLVFSLSLFGVALAAAGLESLIPVLIGVFIIAFSVLVSLWAIQRTHDLDYSGWWSIVGGLPPFFLLWFFKAGTPGPNQFGPPPAPNTRGLKVMAVVCTVFLALAAVGVAAFKEAQENQQPGVRRTG